MDMRHMDMSHMGQMKMGVPPANLALIDTASACIKTGLICTSHCLDSLAMGDMSMAACAKSVDQMMSVCGSLAKLASMGSPHLPEVARLAVAVCQDCEKECQKHAAEHMECKNCADACAACAKESRKFAA